ncbi:hypothetical protein AAF712_005859 [Marasmius tenuissimus]|uniref:Uncharacterized protein n=1 Tax=Marasmius tenuissimus TaxID=585030 RepID=A0ABR3A153_9AGAR
MQFKASALASVLAFFATSSAASPLEARKTLDVWSPRIIAPDASIVWVVGEKFNVTWDTSDAPKQISNGAAVLLRKNDTTAPVEGVVIFQTPSFEYPTPIHPKPWLKPFQSFNLTDGWVEITVPSDAKPDTDYQITLFGDSGNWSKKFEIKAAETGTYEKEAEAN